MTMISMHVSSQTVPESAIEDDCTKNKKLWRVRNLENKIPNIFSVKLYKCICRISEKCYQKKDRK